MTINISAYDYRGFAIVVFASNRTLVHHNNASGRIIYEALNLGDAMRWINAYLA